MRNRNKAVGVVGTIPRKYGWLYFIKHKINGMHPPVATTSEAISGLIYELSELRLRTLTHLMDF